MVKKIQDKFTIQTPKNLAKDIEKYVNDFGYSGPSELFREAIREKIYGRTRGEEIKNLNLQLSKDEEEFLLKENKDIYNKIKKISEGF